MRTNKEESQTDRIKSRRRFSKIRSHYPHYNFTIKTLRQN